MSSWDNDDVNIKGDDGSEFGKKITSSDYGSKHRLHVESDPSAIPGAKLLWEDMNVSNGGVARDAAISTETSIYQKTSTAGLFFGVLVTLESFNNYWIVRLKLDGVTVCTLDTRDVDGGNLYNLKDSPHILMGLTYRNDTLTIAPPNNYPASFSSSLQITAQYKDGASGTKKFRAGLVTRSTL